MGLFSWLSTKKEERAALDISTATVADNGTEDSTAAATLLQAIIGTGAIDADTAMEIPALSAAIDFVSGIVARLPVKLYREENDGSECRTNEITDDPRLRLLNEATGDLMGAYEARAAQISDMFRYGAGYVYINKNGTNVESLHYVNYTDVSVTKSADPIFKDARLYVGGRTYNPWDFIILARKSTDGVRGVSIIDEHKTLLSSMYNTLKFENVSSRTGGNKKGFLQSEKILSKAALAETRKAWEELYANNGNNMMVLNNGLKYTPSASTAVEMQLNQNKLTNTSQLDLAFLLSPDVISGKVSRDQFSLAMTNAVMPIVTVYQEAINRSLLLESEKRSMYFALDTNELLKGDTLTRYQAYAVGLQNNFLQLDEVRYKEDLPATGFNYITLGLNNVLLDPKTNVIYTPNTNQMVKVGEMVKNTEENADEGLQDDEKSGIIEERYSDSQPRDENGRWRGRGGGAISNNMRPVMQSNGGAKIKEMKFNDDGTVSIKYGQSDLPENPNSGNKTINGITYDSDGKPFAYTEMQLEPKEFTKVYSGISTDYSKYKGITDCVFSTVEGDYFFENHDFGKYNIYDKI